MGRAGHCPGTLYEIGAILKGSRTTVVPSPLHRPCQRRATSSNNDAVGWEAWVFLCVRTGMRGQPVAARKCKGFSPETIARREDEMAMLERDFKAVEAGYGQNVLHLTLAGTYIRSLLNNPVVARFLSTQHAGIFA